MFDLFDEDLDDMTLVEGALALNEAIDPDTNVHWANAELERLLKEAELELSHEVNEQARFEAFLRLFIASGNLKATVKLTLQVKMLLWTKCLSDAKASLLAWVRFYSILVKSWAFL